jgi:rhomboid family GlyGly-CTERM serine protease
MAWSGTLKMRFPVITLSTVSASLITYAKPQLANLFIYDRQHVLGGQLWRLFTAPLVHFSASHLIWNLLVFVTAGCLIELAGYRRFGLVCVLTIVAPGLFFLVTKPDLAQYGGLSALATGATAYLCLYRTQQHCRDRRLWMTIFALLIVKIFVEGIIDAPIFAQSDTVPFRVLPSAHTIGIAGAVVVFVSERWKLTKCHFAKNVNDYIQSCKEGGMPIWKRP